MVHKEVLWVVPLENFNGKDFRLILAKSELHFFVEVLVSVFFVTFCSKDKSHTLYFMQHWTSTFALCTEHDDDEVGHLLFATSWINFAFFWLIFNVSEKIVINDDCDCDACASGWLKEKRKAPA